MDVMRPRLEWVDGRCYRVNPVNSDEFKTQEFDDEEEEEELNDDRYCEGDVHVEETAHGCEVRVEVASVYHKYIIGKKGEVKRTLEHETHTQVRIPKMGQEGDIVISGRDKRGVVAAKTRVDSIVSSARRKQPFTHFFSIPFTSDSLRRGFDEFKERVLEKCGNDRGVSESLFQKPCKLHLTIGTLALVSGQERDHGVQELHRCMRDIIRPLLDDAALMVEVEGIEYMNDDPSEIDVLYAKVRCQDGSNKLQLMCDSVVECLVSGGLMCRQYDQVKLHITVMNTLYRQPPRHTRAADESESQLAASNKTQADMYVVQAAAGDRETFDGRNILKHFSEFKFGEQQIKSVHLSQRYSTGPDGFYLATGRADLPAS